MLLQLQYYGGRNFGFYIGSNRNVHTYFLGMQSLVPVKAQGMFLLLLGSAWLTLLGLDYSPSDRPDCHKTRSVSQFIYFEEKNNV